MSAEYRLLIPAKQNRSSGSTDRVEEYLETLKREVDQAIKENFWGRKPGRPKRDPGSDFWPTKRKETA